MIIVKIDDPFYRDNPINPNDPNKVKIEDQIRSNFFDNHQRLWTEKLAPEEVEECPFCGGKDLYIQISVHVHPLVSQKNLNVNWHFWVQCGDMGCWAQGPMSMSRENALKLWNR